MEDEYMIFESKMNHLTLEELNKITPESGRVIINRVKEMLLNPKLSYMEAYKHMGAILCRSVKEKPAQAFNLPRNIYFDVTKQNYVAQKIVDGKKYVIKRSKSLKVVQDALTTFQYEKGIKI